MTTSGQRSALVTRGARGPGLEAARQLGALGWTVFLGSGGDGPGRTAADELSGAHVVTVPLDVTSEESVSAAVRLVGEHTDRLDLLVNVACAPEPGPEGAGVRLGEPGSVYDANVFGPVRVTEGFLPLLRAAERPRVLMLDGSGQAPAGVSDLEHDWSTAALSIVTAVYAETVPEIEFTFAGAGAALPDRVR